MTPLETQLAEYRMALEAILAPYTAEADADTIMGHGSECWCDQHIALAALKGKPNGPG